jgi:chromate transporter
MWSQNRDYSRSLQLGAAIAIGSAILGMRFQVNSAWLVLGGAAIGWLAFSLGYTI